MRTKTNSAAVYWHEAGHAITAAALGDTVRAIEVVPQQKYGGRVHWSAGLDHPAYPIMLAGGITGERLALWNDEHWAERGDRRLLTKWARRHNVSDELDVWRQARRLSGELLMYHSVQWVLLAERLLEGGNLVGDELTGLLPRQSHEARAQIVRVGGCAGQVLLNIHNVEH